MLYCDSSLLKGKFVLFLPLQKNFQIGQNGQKIGSTELLSASFLCVLFYCVTADRRGRNHLFSVTTSSTYFDQIPGLKDLNSKGRRKTDLPVFDFGSVAAATSNFSSANELGQGGFGSVYKVINLPIQLNPNVYQI